MELRTPFSWEKSSISPFFSLTRECARVTFFETLFNSPKTAFDRLCPPTKTTAEATQPESRSIGTHGDQL